MAGAVREVGVGGTGRPGRCAGPPARGRHPAFRAQPARQPVDAPGAPHGANRVTGQLRRKSCATGLSALTVVRSGPYIRSGFRNHLVLPKLSGIDERFPAARNLAEARRVRWQ